MRPLAMKGKKSGAGKKSPGKDEDRERAKPISVWTKKDEQMAEENKKDEELEIETDRDSK